MPTAERGPGEKRFVVRVVREVGDDPPDAQPAGAQGVGCRRPLPYCCINSLMGQTVSPEMRSWLAETAHSFHGAQRRRFMAQSVQALGLSQRQAALALGWARDTVRKGLHELHSGITCLDNFSARG